MKTIVSSSVSPPPFNEYHHHHHDEARMEFSNISESKRMNKKKGLLQIMYSFLTYMYELIITFIVRILRYDPKTNRLLPRHIAFIMDGNRRWAREKNIPIKEGHRSGYKKLKQCLNWCEMLGVKTVTVYAFSIDNFKRDKHEVDNIMDLMDRRFKDMVTKKKSFIHRYRVILRVLGDFKLFPKYVQESAQKAIDYSKQVNSKYGDDALILNLCCPYTSTFEIENAMTNYISEKLKNSNHVKQQSPFASPFSETLVISQSPSPSTTTSVNTATGNFEDAAAQDSSSSLLSTIREDFQLLDKYFLTKSEPDIVIRTSGEMRLSDFLTWQSEKSMIYISSLYWPEFSFWQLVSVIFQYQQYRFKKG
ncbi:hypothetical protein FDP41_001359 [Naegleria fowleri]|uniref:Alkyl transferase n=1 Tax=Naegleria fowleri TaxID=5763 RepID=A0A6A5BYS4_NAEFO|nr:uncharacterized protein FDP41_001359 [Naegleria fowleri]KAF0979691.1 hypothetical protein FDP41_001359 [Naegleria fowleri]CAG4718969.1 unnamed protein product [Naegleria fowleri]